MDLRKTKKEETKEARSPIGYKCKVGDNPWVFFREKTCRYCIPVFDASEKSALQGKDV